MVAIQDRMVTVWRNEVRTRVKVAGNGPPLLFLHGAYGLTWDPFLDALAAGHTVYAPEFPGTTPGDPDGIKPIDTLWDLVLYYDELLDALGLESTAVVGHSFGGMVAAEIAANSARRVSKLVLIDAIGLWRDDTPVKNWMGLPADVLPGLILADPEGPLGKMIFTPPADPEAAMDALIQRNWSLACTGKFVWPIPDKGLKKRIHRIASPTLIVWGAKDGIVPAVYAQDFANAIGSNARVEIIDGAAHLPQLEQLEQVSALVQKFLA